MTTVTLQLLTITQDAILNLLYIINMFCFLGYVLLTVHLNSDNFQLYTYYLILDSPLQCVCQVCINHDPYYITNLLHLTRTESMYSIKYHAKYTPF
jgi:hypothetical protein